MFLQIWTETFFIFCFFLESNEKFWGRLFMFKNILILNILEKKLKKKQYAVSSAVSMQSKFRTIYFWCQHKQSGYSAVSSKLKKENFEYKYILYSVIPYIKINKK